VRTMEAGSRSSHASVQIPSFHNSDDGPSDTTEFARGYPVSTPLPSFVKEITGEVDSSYWKPQSLKEWTTSVKWNSWAQHQTQMRDLRRRIAIWIFCLITGQVLAVFGVVILDACGVIKANAEITKFLIPSVLAEVFG